MKKKTYDGNIAKLFIWMILAQSLENGFSLIEIAKIPTQKEKLKKFFGF
jgi:hypothetical protein